MIKEGVGMRLPVVYLIDLLIDFVSLHGNAHVSSMCSLFYNNIF